MVESQTAVVAITYSGGALVAADTAISAAGETKTSRKPKVFSASGGEVLLGMSGHVRSMDRAKHELELRSPTEFSDLYEFCVLELVPALEKATSDRSQFLVASGTEIAGIGPKGSVVISENDYQAIGSGRKHAHGALEATEGLEPRQRAKKALEAAAEHDKGVEAPFHIVTTQNPNPRSL